MGVEIHEGESFRNPQKSRIEEPVVDGYRNIKNVTRGSYGESLDFGKGMARVGGKGKGDPIPAFSFLTKEKGGEFEDVIDTENRYVKYYGDNNWRKDRVPYLSAYDSYGIEHFSESEGLFMSDSEEERGMAPPILIWKEFRTKENLAMREFVGVGVLISSELVMQPHERGEFENVVYHISLIDLPGGALDWSWIDDMRCGNDRWENAPEHWARWVREGHGCLNPVGRKKSIAGKSELLRRVSDPFTRIEEREPDDGTGHVYVITNPAWDGWVKIGRARDAKERRRNYLTYSPRRDYALEHAVYCEDRKKGEEDAHEHATEEALGRRKSEWFPLTVEAAKKVVNMVGTPIDLDDPGEEGGI